MEKKKCELCCGVARTFCDSDQANLCFDCDGKVHGANFLVAKHTRCLLCSACQSHTPWKASGLRLRPTVSICEPCVVARKNISAVAVAGRVSMNQNLSQEIDDVESYEDDEEESSDEEAENQVVPLDATATAEQQQSPVVSSSSSVSISGGEDFSGDGELAAKRRRRGLDLNESRPLKRLSRSAVKINSDRKSNGCDSSSSSSS
ncbi:unnamed protein product [Cochlearia groenlandica]